MIDISDEELLRIAPHAHGNDEWPGSYVRRLAEMVAERDAIIAAHLPHQNGPDATTPGDPDAWNAAMFNLGQAISERDALAGECERLRMEHESLAAHHKRVVDQRNKDWDALMALIAKALGTDEDREAAEMDEVDEFDPWHALRTYVDERDALKAQVASYAVGSAAVVGSMEHLNWSAFQAGGASMLKQRDSAISERDAARAKLAEVEKLVERAFRDGVEFGYEETDISEHNGWHRTDPYKEAPSQAKTDEEVRQFLAKHGIAASPAREES